MVCDTWPSQDASTHQIWNELLPQKYRNYALDLMLILETRFEVKVTENGMVNPPFPDAFTHQVW